MFKIDDRDIKEFERTLGELNKRGIGFATRHTLNSVAFNTMREYKETAREEMTVRNKWTERSIRVDRARSLDPKRQEATVGSVADYMEDQEFGTTRVKKGSEGVPIVTAYAAGQEGRRPRTRQPRKGNKLQNIMLANRRKKGRSRKQQNFIAVREAAASGDKFVYLDLGRRKGIFRVVGGKRRPRVKMVYDLSEESVTIPRNPMLQPSVKREGRKLPEIYKKALLFQLDRIRKR